MTLSESEPNAPLLSGISQFEVDFVIPRVGVDIQIGIDPFLLYKSRDLRLAELHKALVTAFNTGIEALKQGDRAGARYLLDFPEVWEIGLGYTEKGKRGSGVGNFLSELIIETLMDSPRLMERGVRHVEEMQLVSVGIGPDRISDITANIIKQFLIEYTQKQCQIWNIPLKSGVPLEHIFEPEKLEWYDDYVNLPVSPIDNCPILLVPRRIVRVLPWINYDDYLRMEFSAYLRAKRVRFKSNTSSGKHKRNRLQKEEVVFLTRNEVERIERYVKAKEEAAEQAQPSLSYLDDSATCQESERIKAELVAIQPGTTEASKYQRLVLEILNFLFNPELIDGEMEVKTFDETERRDIIFTNDSDQSFWSYVRTEHSAFLLMFEVKNTDSVETSHLNQTATYLGERLGRFGFLVTRKPPSEAKQKKTFSIYNDSNPRKIILILSDQDLREMLDMKCRRADPMRFIQRMYRKFRQSVQ